MRKNPEETKHGEQLYQNAGGDDGHHVIDSKAGRSFGEAQAKGNTKEPIATSVYLTLSQLEKVKRLIAKRQVEDSAKLGRHVSKMSFADFIRLVIDELPE